MNLKLLPIPHPACRVRGYKASSIMKPQMIALIASSLLSSITLAGLEAGEQINLTIRGVEPAELQKVSGIYRIGESGGVRLPLLDALVTARGLTPEQFARTAETAYRLAGIYDGQPSRWKYCKTRISKLRPSSVSVGRCVGQAIRFKWSRKELSTAGTAVRLRKKLMEMK